MKFQNNLLAALFALALVGTASQSHSADVVYDPWNHAKNISQLAQQVKQVQQMITMLNNQGQLLNMANLNQMKWVIDLVKVHNLQGSLPLLQGQLSQLYNKALDAQGATKGIYRQYLSSNLSWDEYIDREQRISEANQGVHTAGFQHATRTLEGLEQQHQAIRDLSDRTDTSQGTQQLLQTLNKHMNLIASQNSQILALMAQKSQSVNDEQVQQEMKKQKRIEHEKKVDSAAKRTLDSMNALTGFNKAKEN